MAITEHDLKMYAHRVRVHFPKELRDLAEELALAIAQWAGPRTKLLRPETTLPQILLWMAGAPLGMGIAKAAGSPEGLAAVEAMMALRRALAWELPDEVLDETTYLALVQHEAERRTRKRFW